MYAALKEDSFQLDEVTKAYRISRHHLAKVVQRLAQLGYLETRRGRKGGIMLARAPEDIRLRPAGPRDGGAAGHRRMLRSGDQYLPDRRQLPAEGHPRQRCVEFYAVLDRHTLRDTVHGPHRAKMTKALLG
jgi:Rrf2 family nitric oxide-sensitive transcriptional repressor